VQECPLNVDDAPVGYCKALVSETEVDREFLVESRRHGHRGRVVNPINLFKGSQIRGLEDFVHVSGLGLEAHFVNEQVEFLRALQVSPENLGADCEDSVEELGQSLCMFIFCIQLLQEIERIRFGALREYEVEAILEDLRCRLKIEVLVPLQSGLDSFDLRGVELEDGVH